MSKYSEVLRKLLIDAHGRGSGIEKGILDSFFLPHNNPVYLSTALGFEEAIKDAGIEQMQNDLYDFLQKQLVLLKTNNVKLDCKKWSDFRKEFIKAVSARFSLTVAETRRPLNDITLFDQTTMSVAFFKAALAENLLSEKGKAKTHDNAAYRYRWRLLKVGLNGLDFWGNARLSVL